MWTSKKGRTGQNIFFKFHLFFVVGLNCEGLQESKCLVKYSPHCPILLYRPQGYLTWRLQWEWDWKKNCPPDSYTHHKNYRTETKGWCVWLTRYPFPLYHLSINHQSITESHNQPLNDSQMASTSHELYSWSHTHSLYLAAFPIQGNNEMFFVFRRSCNALHLWQDDPVNRIHALPEVLFCLSKRISAVSEMLILPHQSCTYPSNFDQSEVCWFVNKNCE